MHLVLMGLRGSGKSMLGARLAARHRLRFVDLDQRTPGILGVRSVAEAWNRYGEAAFREAEVAALREVIDEDPEILALGGGTPMAPGGADLVRSLKEPAGASRPRVVYLRADAATLARRLRESGVADRPSLTGTDPINEIAQVLAMRDPVYLALADAVVETGRLDLEGALRELDSMLGRG